MNPINVNTKLNTITNNINFGTTDLWALAEDIETAELRDRVYHMISEIESNQRKAVELIRMFHPSLEK
jgi:hypothetical protein